MDARRTRYLLTPLYKKLSSTKPLDEFNIFAIHAEVSEIREMSKEAGIDISSIEKQLADNAIQEMDVADYLENINQLNQCFPFIGEKGNVFSQFEMSDLMADAYLSICLKQVDHADSSEQLSQIIYAADKFYLAGRHDYFMKYMDYLSESFSFTKIEVAEFFRKENGGSCASALSYNLAMVMDIMKSCSDFFIKYGETWDKYKQFIHDYCKTMGTMASIKAESIDEALRSVKRIEFGELSNYIVVKSHSPQVNFDVFTKTDLCQHAKSFDNFEIFNSVFCNLALSIRIYLDGRFGEITAQRMRDNIVALCEGRTKETGVLFEAEDVENKRSRIIDLAKRLECMKEGEVGDFLFKHLTLANSPKQLIIECVGSRRVLQNDLGL